MESKVFALHKGAVGEAAADKAHVSLTLVLLGNLPTMPTADGGEPAPKVEARETLDVSFDDEETFGLWVAALRALM